jgi:hypothetical protein
LSRFMSDVRCSRIWSPLPLRAYMPPSRRLSIARLSL